MSRLAILALLFALPSLGCRTATGRPCRPLPTPTASAFDSCGSAMGYHAEVGAETRYTVRFKDGLGDKYKLVAFCVLMDDDPIFTKAQVEELAPTLKKNVAEWSGKISYVRHTVKVQAVYDWADNPSPTDRLVLRGASEIAPADGAVLAFETFDKGGDGPLDQRLGVRALIPSGTMAPRCE